MMPAESHAPPSLEIEIPPELLAAVEPHDGLRPRDLAVEGWRPSLLGRVAALLLPKRR